MTSHFTIVPAAKDDISEISSFFEQADLIHRHLDWHTTLEWLGVQPFLLLKKDEKFHALLAAPIDPPLTAWIHCFAVLSSRDLDVSWKALFDKAWAMLAAQGASVFAVGLKPWFCELLANNGFVVKQDIVVLSWDHHFKPIPGTPDDVLFRPMLESDLDEVADLDAHSFEQQWVMSADSIRLAFIQSQHTTVAEIAGKIVAYELSTSNQYSAHLARLAVLPEYRRGQIARRLVTNMLHRFTSQGVLQVTVNTQSDNAASLNLYQSLGFFPTGESFPVLQH